MRSTVWALGAALLLASSPAFAQGDKGDVELGIYGGYGWLDEFGGLNPKDGPLYGGRIGYFFSRHVSAELSGQRLSTHTPESAGVPEVDVHLDSGRANLLFNFDAQGMIRPFITGGIGFEKLDAANRDDTSQMTWNAGAGLRMFPAHNWNVRLDGNYFGMKPDQLEDLQSNYSAALGVSWLFGGGASAEEAAAVTTAPNQPPTVTCAADRNEIMAGETVKVHATASDPDGDPLDYVWTTTGGHVVGMGADASLDFAGATPPTNATVTVKVRDNHGNSATSDCTVALAAPAPPPKAEAVSCLAGGFPKNTSRLTNVDKACLDDVAQRLKSDPRASVTVIGYADSHEKSATTIADARAKAVRDYLTTERSIDTSRITVRSSGSTNPVDTGTDLTAQGRNRRVVVWFVPEGATIPE
jgi:outer membrane protein OmpA-like peptidoglycan-associated protein/opacity protein-like surface antigen